jgi:hypothetical protein
MDQRRLRRATTHAETAAETAALRIQFFAGIVCNPR